MARKIAELRILRDERSRGRRRAPRCSSSASSRSTPTPARGAARPGARPRPAPVAEPLVDAVVDGPARRGRRGGDRPVRRHDGGRPRQRRPVHARRRHLRPPAQRGPVRWPHGSNGCRRKPAVLHRAAARARRPRDGGVRAGRRAAAPLRGVHRRRQADQADLDDHPRGGRGDRLRHRARTRSASASCRSSPRRSTSPTCVRPCAGSAAAGRPATAPTAPGEPGVDRSGDLAGRRAGRRARGPDHRVGPALDRVRPRAGRLDRDHPAVRLRGRRQPDLLLLPRARRVGRPRDRLDLRRPRGRARGRRRARRGDPGARA